jgi:hypothetical protein
MTRRHVALGAVALLCAACASDQPAPTAVELRVPLFASANAGGNRDFNLGTHLTGAEEVLLNVPAGDPHPRDSRAQGQAIFRVSDDGMSVRYKLIVANIENVFQAHIHRAAAGSNGPIVVWLYPSTAPVAGPFGGGRIQGVIAEGTITAANLVGPLLNQPLSALLDAIRSGGTYVNVHTSIDGPPVVNTGPGDFPGGEIRGQIDHASSHSGR